MRRRAFLRLALAGVGGAAIGVPLSACGAESGMTPARTRPGLRPAAAAGSCWRTSRARARTTGTAAGGTSRSATPRCWPGRSARAWTATCTASRPSIPTPPTTTRPSGATCASRTADARPAIADPLRRSTATTHPARQPDLERQGADDHDDVHRALRLRGQDRPPGHDPRHERPRHDPRGLRPGCRGARIGTGLAVRGEQARSAGAGRRVAAPSTGLLRRAEPTPMRRRRSATSFHDRLHSEIHR